MINIHTEEIKRAYFRIILEEALNNSNIEDLPNPFKNLLEGLKQAISKAINATTDKLKQINDEVNIWRDKILSAWKQLSNTLSNQQKTSINDILLDLVTKYTNYMHGCNTGY